MDSTGPREYIYYSDRKIIELAQQMPRPPGWIRRITSISEVGIQVMGTGGSIKWADVDPEQTLQTLQSVWQWLEEGHYIGTFDDPTK